MTRRTQTVRQGDLTRALRAAKAAREKVRRVEIEPDGRIVVLLGEETETWDAAEIVL